jgi:hypothetical protein
MKSPDKNIPAPAVMPIERELWQGNLVINDTFKP